MGFTWGVIVGAMLIVVLMLGIGIGAILTAKIYEEE